MVKSMQSNLAFVKVKYSNGYKTIYCSSNGTFLCICQQYPNGHQYRLTQSLIKHASLVEALELNDNIAEINNNLPYSLEHQPSDLPPPVSTSQNLYSFNARNFAHYGEYDSEVWTKEMVLELMSQPIQYGDQILFNPYMEQFGLAYHSVLNAVICIHHHIVLKPNYIFRHLEADHPSQKLSQTTARKVIENIWHVPNAPVTMQTAGFWYQVQGLPILLGYQCGVDECDHITASAKTLKLHIRQIHHISPNSQNIHYVPIQRFHKHALPFPIIPTASPTSTTLDNVIETLTQQVDNLYTTPTGEFSTNNRLISPWLLATKWPEMFQGQNMEALAKLAQKPLADEVLLQRASTIVELFVQNAIAKISQLPELILQRINTSDPAKTGINNTPFHKHQQGDTTTRTYIDELERLLCSILRNNQDVYPLDLPLSVAQHLQAFREALAEETTLDAQLVLLLHQLLFSLWTESWPQSRITNYTTDPTILYLAFRMIIPAGGFREPVQTTPIIARITYCLRLAFVMEFSTKLNQLGYDISSHCDYLEKHFTEKHHYTFNSLRSLQHLASTLAIKQKSLPRVVWLDRHNWDHMLYLGDEIKFSNLCQVFADIESDIIPLWENKLMLGTNLSVDTTSTLLHDNLTAKEPSYSLFSDTRNSHLLHRNDLLTAILSTPNLRDHFIVGIDMQTNMPQWNKVQLRSWLYAYSQFTLLLMMRWEMLSGSPARGTELVSMLVQNTQTRPRNLYAVGIHLALIGQYHKSGALSGADKLLPRAGDALTTNLTLQSLVLARPFAKLAAAICYPNDAKVVEAYRDLLFPNIGRAFESEELSDAMAKVTSKILGVRLGLNGYRHVSIAFRRMLVDRSSEADTEKEIMRHVEAEQAGHSEHVEQTVYAVSLDSIGEYSDQMLGIFCDASARWQTKCHVVPTGVSLPYTNTLSTLFDSLQQQSLFKIHEPVTFESHVRDMLSEIKDFVTETISQANNQLATSLLEKLQPLLTNTHSINTLENVSSPTIPYPKVTSSSVPAANITPPRPPPLSTTFSPTRLPGKRRGTTSIVINSSPTKKGREFSPHSSNSSSDEEMALAPVKPASLTFMAASTATRPTYRMEQSSVRKSEASLLARPQLSEKAKGKQPAIPYILPSSNQVISKVSASMVMPSQLLQLLQLPTKTEQHALTMLQQLLKNPNATWSCIAQHDGILVALNAIHDMIVIAPTGSGKTMIPIILSMLNQHKITVVVIPLISLRDDYIRRLTSLNVPFSNYETGMTASIPPSTSLLLVSADTAVRQHFQQALRMIHNHRPVAAFVYDEGQLAVTDNTYRDSLRDASEVRCLPVPMYILSGSAPPKSIPAMATIFGLAKPYIEIRNCTDRPELEYILEEERPKYEIKNRLTNLIVSARSTLQSHERILIFVQKVDYGIELARHFQCGFYSGDKTVTPDRAKTYNDWLNGIYNILIGTSALLAGNDYLHVRYVFFASTPADATGFLQGAGRGGRDHIPSKVIILPHKRSGNSWFAKGEDHAGSSFIASLCANNPPLCLRWSLCNFADGHGVLCKDSTPNGQHCSNCQKASLAPGPISSINTTTSYFTSQDSFKLLGGTTQLQPDLNAAMQIAVTRRQERTSGSQPIIDTFNKGFAVFGTDCTYCGDKSHTLPRCQQVNFTEIRTFRRQISYGTFTADQKRLYGTICFSCHVPQLPGDAIHGPYGRQVRCEHADFMMGILFRIKSSSTILLLAQQEFGFDTNHLSFWLSLRPEPTLAQPLLPYYVSNFTRLVCWYINKYI